MKEVACTAACHPWPSSEQWHLLLPVLPCLTISHKCVFDGFPNGAHPGLVVRTRAHVPEEERHA